MVKARLVSLQFAMPTSDYPNGWSLLKRQAAACAVFGALLTVIIGTLYSQHRQREWLLRSEEAKHRLDVAFELISREVNRVRADAMYLANRGAVRSFASGDVSRRDELSADCIQFVESKELYDQIRLLGLNGRETIRINYVAGKAAAVSKAELQDKSDRYYFQEALTLDRGEIFVSEFDLNLEHGKIEQPLKPVIRFVTPVVDDAGQMRAFLVLNYLGAALLKELDDAAIPGFTMLLRPDGHFLRSPHAEDSWGWLLGHDRTFPAQFPQEWSQLASLSDCRLTVKGAFAVKQIPLGKKASTQNPAAVPGAGDGPYRQPRDRDSILIVSYLPREAVFSASNELLRRLLIFAAGVFVLAIAFTRAWARAILTRELQARRIATSEEQLRQLSSRLLRIQEEERRAISREIHDELGQQVTAINLDLKLAERNIESNNAKPHLQRAINENETLLQTLHEFAKRVRPAVLDDLGLRDAIESHLSEFQDRTGVVVEAKLQFDSTDIPNNIADNTYRLLQESLNNVAKHADATTVSINLSLECLPNKHLLLTVRDNGCGHDGTGDGRRLGLIGMRERVDLLAGEFEMESSINKGTSINIRLPISGSRSGEAT